METLIRLLSAADNIAIVALLAGNVAQGAWLAVLRRDHESERLRERTERSILAQQTTHSMEKLTDVITELRLVIAACGLRHGGHHE